MNSKNKTKTKKNPPSSAEEGGFPKIYTTMQI